MYLFDEAQTAADRRAFRKARRRNARHQQRLMLLQTLFKDEVEKSDPLFFLRLNNSAYVRTDKDKKLSGKDALFGGNGYRDRDYFKQYPTIYHLRSAFAHGDEIKDVRLLYLAVHHILKHRGHFLFKTQSVDIGDHTVMLKAFSDMNAWIQDEGAEYGMETLEAEDLEAVIKVLADSKLGKRNKYQSIAALYGLTKAKGAAQVSLQHILKAICGMTFNLNRLFIAADDCGCATDTVSFDSVDFDENIMPGIESGYGEDMAEFVRILKSIYDWSMFCDVMNGHAYISDAKVERYEKHKADLAYLKAYVRKNCPERYASVFCGQRSRMKAGRVSNYAGYVGMDSRKSVTRCSKEEFYKFLKNDLKVTDETILAEMDKGTFMPLQTCRDNACVPYQATLVELEAILDNAVKQFPFLNRKEGRLSVRDRIVMLMTFHVPYYVGPLKGGFSWAKFAEGKEDVKVTPWNFDKVIDHNASEDAFIGRMTSKCTYLPDQDVLPSASFLYSEYKFLNELNCLKFNGERNERVRQFIYDYAKTHRKVSLDACLKDMVSRGILPKGTKKEQFTGIDRDFVNSLASYNDFAFMGARRDAHPEMCEDIIRWITVISDKNRLEARIKENYGRILSEAEISRLASLKYKGWGRLSGELLEGIRSPGCTGANGEPVSIMEKMRESGESFMEIYHNCGFADVVSERNRGLYSDDVTYSMINDMYSSPSVKRSVWRAVELVREIVKVCGGQPKKIFVEVGRSVKYASRKGQRSKTRKEKLLELHRQPEVHKYAKQLDGGRDWVKEIESAPDNMFDDDRVYLYYMQFGRSMYSLKEINLRDIYNQNICDRDHIYPQSKVVDDSLNNLVLVLRSENRGKEDGYPVSADIRSKMQSYWAQLRSLGMITSAKYFRLVRNTPLSENEMTDFTNRQLTFTFQSAKAVVEAMQKLLPVSEVAYVKSRSVNDFRDKFDIIKVRALNDLHHAKDAYLNIVVGNVYNTLFGHNACEFFMQNENSVFDFTTLYNNDIRGAWSTSSKDRIIRTAEKDDCNVVRMVISGHGEMFARQVVPPGSFNGMLPIKDRAPLNDTNLYGGYTSEHVSYSMVVRSLDKNGNPVLTLEGYPLHYDKRYGSSTEEKVRFCTERLGLRSPSIVLDNIKTGTLMYKNGSYVTLNTATRTDVGLRNANQLHLDNNSTAILNEVCMYIDSCSKYREKNLPLKESVSTDNLLALYDVFTEKLALPVYRELRPQTDYAGFLMDARPKFINMTREQQAMLLYEILHLLQCKTYSPANLSAIGGGRYAGLISMGKIVSEKDLKFIFRSPTGYYTRIVTMEDLCKSAGRGMTTARTLHKGKDS
ncbi:MAG: type II CRISPR RNA-guided endonuclease Cas9 [Clostridia bacterium]|nr:type II CRISPR RNA-guided endonuclease Cas9 [Clostridia bacterium]